VKRAIISCHDKSGLVEFATWLQESGVEIISTSGTLELLRENGIEAIGMRDFTGVPEMMSGRVKSLHPKIHAGLLGIRDNRLHEEQMEEHEYDWIDLVIVNLHPVAELISQAGITMDDVIEQIDIGGAAMIRSAAKNFRYVTVATNPSRYASITHEMRAHDGDVPFTTRYSLAREAFAHTAQYDQIIADYLESATPAEE
jgi:phosphoribosylaminoimidazolecarboxamide formyltransferase/IMP cyclohydrolase